jgi:hypothetical protein
MAYVPKCKWDVFISYAHGDFADLDSPAGWIASFEKLLKQELNTASGERFDIYLDKRSQPLNHEIDEIPADVSESAVFLMIGSNNYVKSDWCWKEAKTFIDRFDDRRRVYIAEFMRLREDLAYPVFVPNNRRIPFWFDDPWDVRLNITPRMGMFKRRVAQIAQAIWKQLDILKREAELGPDPAGPGGDETEPAERNERKTVFLAFAADDVGADRLRVKNYLEDQGLVVLPEILHPPADALRYRALVERGLGKADIFVQLLGQSPSQPVEGVARGYTLDQYDAAKSLQANGLAILQWRPNHVRVSEARDKAYRKLLEGETVQTGSLTQFNRRIVGVARPAPPPTVPRGIFINATETDGDRALDLIEVCIRKEKFAALADADTDPETLRAHYANASMVTLLYGNSGRQWVQSQVDIFARAWAEAGPERKPPLIVYLAPPENKGPDGPKPGRPRLPFAVPKLHILDTRRKWSVRPFARAIEKLA